MRKCTNVWLHIGKYILLNVLQRPTSIFPLYTPSIFPIYSQENPKSKNLTPHYFFSMIIFGIYLRWIYTVRFSCCGAATATAGSCCCESTDSCGRAACSLGCSCWGAASAPPSCSCPASWLPRCLFFFSLFSFRSLFLSFRLCK